MADFNRFYEPGMIVENPDRPDWGLGQIQSSINNKVTVNFQNEGKVVLNSDTVILIPVVFDR